MTLTEELTYIVEKEKDVLPFLKKLEKSQKKDLNPIIKKLHKYYTDYVESSSGSYSPRGTNAQRMILSLAAFVCLNQKDFERTWSFGIINKETLSNILPWYCPDWFNSYADKLATDGFISGYFDYDWYLELIDQGYLIINKRLIADVLPNVIYQKRSDNWKFEYKPENLIKRNDTLDEHIWYFFEMESHLHNIDNYKQFEEGSRRGGWMDAFKLYVNDGKINRERLLRESISSVTKNFNQSLSNWFMDLFMFLEPTKAELIRFQSELLNTFNSLNSKPYNLVLKLFKDLVTEPDFLVPPFLDHVPLVLTAQSKTAASSALMVLEKLAKKHPDLRGQICVIASQGFIHQDNNIQVRTAKLIQKYGDKNDGSILEAVSAYYDALFQDSRNILTDFSKDIFLDSAVVEDNVQNQTDQVLPVIKMPVGFDDFVFLLSQAFDQNELYHFDLVPAAILKFHSQITADNILKLMPAFQRAYKLLTGDWGSTRGYLDDMLATFLVSYGKLLVKSKGGSARALLDMHDHFVKLEDDKKAKWAGYNKRLGEINGWDVYSHSLGYKPHKHILLNAFFLLEKNIRLPLLSTPTHEPCWVSANILIERLSLYQKMSLVPGDMDAQIAFARCIALDKAEAIKLANNLLTGEMRDLIGFVLGEEHKPKDSYKLSSAWLVVAVMRSKPGIDAEWLSYSELADVWLTGEFEWNSFVEHSTYKRYDFSLKRDVDVPSKSKIIRINFGNKERKISVLKSVLNKILPPLKSNNASIYNFTELKFQYLSAEHNDVKRLLCLTPHQPEILLAHVINKGLKYVDFTGENEKKLVIYTLETLLTLNTTAGSMFNLFIASCLISSDKTARAYAAELWIKGVSHGTMESSLIGTIIGKHEQIELAPLKRFTDLVISNMFQISRDHNKALQNMLTACIATMNDKPINGSKKLLEIYAEVLSANKSNVDDDRTIQRLNAWENTESLKKTIEKLKML